MHRTVLNTFCLTALLVSSACNKDAEDTASNSDTVAADELPMDGSDEQGSEEESEDPAEGSEEGEGQGSPEGEPPAGDDGSSEEGTDDETETEDPADASTSGGYTGDMTITITTSFGPDTCAGSAAIEISEDGTLNGSGTCSFGILGAQSPVLAGTVAEDGTVTGTVDLVAFSSPFTLAWDGVKDENTLVSEYSGSDSLAGVGDITYDVDINLEVEVIEEGAGAGADAGGSLDEYIDFSASGDELVIMTAGTYTSTDGCELPYELYTTDAAVTDTLTVIQHGFARSKNEFTDMASHFASWGMPALTMDLCHSWAFDVDINQNGADVVELVAELWEGPVVYLGHSNGAISSLVAASMDDQAVAVLGLDPVERPGGDHTDVAATLDIPVAGIFGEAGVCNTWNSGMDAYMAAPDNDLYRAAEADHCDFEAPTGTVCTLACSGTPTLFSDEEIRSNLIGLGTAYISWHATGDTDAFEWASPTGGARAALESLGAISGL